MHICMQSQWRRQRGKIPLAGLQECLEEKQRAIKLTLLYFFPSLIYWIFYFLRSVDIIFWSCLDLKLTGLSQYMLKENLFSSGVNFSVKTQMCK